MTAVLLALAMLALSARPILAVWGSARGAETKALLILLILLVPFGPLVYAVVERRWPPPGGERR